MMLIGFQKTRTQPGGRLGISLAELPNLLVSVHSSTLDLTNPFSSVVQFNNARFRQQTRSLLLQTLSVVQERKCDRVRACSYKPFQLFRSKNAIGVLKDALGKCRSEADKSDNAIGVLKKFLGTLRVPHGRLAT